MRYILTVVEQLDRAARELETDHPINNRLALILVDNATELILHRQCTDYLTMDDLLPTLRPKQRRMAKGESLVEKLRFLEKMNDLTSAERQFIRIAHQYRNDLYHIGLKHDDIIRAISGCYFLLCCLLFARLGPFPYSCSKSSVDIYTDVAKRYLPICNGRIKTLSVELEALAEKLCGAIPDGIPILSEALAKSARRSIKEVEESFEFAIRNFPCDVSADETLQMAQWQLDLTRALEEEDVSGLWIEENYRNNVTRVANALEVTWKQRHTSLPTEKWMHRAGAVEREADPFIAMKLYQSLRDDMSYLEESIFAIEAKVDLEIQQAIDWARGK